MDVHKNYDAVFKEVMVLFKDKTLDFLGLHNIAPITEPLRTENVRIEINSELLDLTFALQDGKGAHFEEEVDLSRDDMLRFGSYHLNLCRVYKRDFITIIFLKNPTNIKELRTEQLNFTPIIVQCSEFNADVVLDRLKTGVANGEPINELELIYLPLFHSNKYSPTELFRESAALAKALQIEDNRRMKVAALLYALAGKVVETTELDKFWEEVNIMGNKIIEYAEGYGAKKEMEKTVRRMISLGYDFDEIIKVTGIAPEHLREITESEAVLTPR
ncbi:MAG: hypothetical protein LBS19_05375 [Clostridiales bacterium]|jgi:hypothetical protein|nr:hypothetical protein [Clostridiales bacterium]